jgi:hypothetical protein
MKSYTCAGDDYTYYKMYRTEFNEKINSLCPGVDINVEDYRCLTTNSAVDETDLILLLTNMKTISAQQNWPLLILAEQ